MTETPRLLKESVVRRYLGDIQLAPDAIVVLNRSLATMLREAAEETINQGRRRIDGVIMRRVCLQ